MVGKGRTVIGWHELGTELGWSPWASHDWTSFRTRLAAHGPRLDAMGFA
nr:hypothetical protein GCM10017745_57020 [Saccharothrix mutabilis subsp. capreolus]